MSTGMNVKAGKNLKPDDEFFVKNSRNHIDSSCQMVRWPTPPLGWSFLLQLWINGNCSLFENFSNLSKMNEQIFGLHPT